MSKRAYRLVEEAYNKAKLLRPRAETDVEHAKKALNDKRQALADLDAEIAELVQWLQANPKPAD